MSVSDEVLLAIALIIKKKEEKEENEAKRKRKRLWMKEPQKNRPQFNLLKELHLSSPLELKKCLSLNFEQFTELLNLLKPFIKKKDTIMRSAIPPAQRLAIALRYLTTGNLFEELKFESAISAQSIGKIVIETCEAIIKVLKEYMKWPETAEEWKNIADGFYEKWNFPNCLGAVDGKHIAIKKPQNSGSTYYNYKKFFSVVLMAVVNSNYEFTAVDVGINGRFSDGGVLYHTKFGKALNENKLSLPEPEELPGSERVLPYTFVGDDKFQLRDNFMTLFPHNGLSEEQRIFNDRLSRAQSIVENAFGILSSQFGVFQRTFNLIPEKVQTIVLACCYLHNYLRKNTSQDLPSGSTDEDECCEEIYELPGLQPCAPPDPGNSAKLIRQQFCEYFNNEGKVSFQNDII